MLPAGHADPCAPGARCAACEAANPAATFDSIRAARAVAAKALREAQEEALRNAELAHLAAQHALQAAEAAERAETTPLTTQDRLRLAFAALRKKGYTAKMGEVIERKAEEPVVHFGDRRVAFQMGEPWSERPESRSIGHPLPLYLMHDGSATAIREAVTVLRYFGVAASWTGETHDAIRVEPRLKKCDECEGQGRTYDIARPAGQRSQPCAPCKGEGFATNPAGIVGA